MLELAGARRPFCETRQLVHIAADVAVAMAMAMAIAMDIRSLGLCSRAVGVHGGNKLGSLDSRPLVQVSA